MRRTKPEKRKIPGDVKYNNKLVQGFINRLMKKGKKSTANRIMYDSFEMIEARAKRDALEVFEQAIRNTSPVLEVKPRRVGGATYQVPVEVSISRANSLAVRWILRYAKERPGKSMIEKLSSEILDAVNNRGGAIKKREDTHKMAEANRAFAHYKW